MKRQVLNLRTVLMCIAAAGAGTGTALAQSADPSLTPAPNEACPGDDANCPPAQTAQPQPYTPPPQQQRPMTQEEEPTLKRYGLALSVGGGVADYIDQNMRDVTGISGTWEARAYVGLARPIGLEVAYVGSARSIDSVFGPVIDSNLYGNGVEGVARINIFDDLPIQPYGIIGIGWTHWSTSGDFTLADTGVEDKDDVLMVPMGLGAAWRQPFGYGGWLLDARFTFRASFGDDLVVSEPVIIDNVPIVAGEFVDTDTWEVSARVGYEFF
jgi:hypothetical protein